MHTTAAEVAIEYQNTKTTFHYLALNLFVGILFLGLNTATK